MVTTNRNAVSIFFPDDLRRISNKERPFAAEAVSRSLCKLKPDAAIRCSAWTALDVAKKQENRDKMFALKAKGPENISVARDNIDAEMIFLNTDYIFDRQGRLPWF